MIAINGLAVENEVADNMHQRPELDYFTSLSKSPTSKAVDLGVQAPAEVMSKWQSGLPIPTRLCNDPLAYADLILNGAPEAYLKAITDYKSLD